MELLTITNLHPLAFIVWTAMGVALVYYWLSSFGLFK